MQASPQASRACASDQTRWTTSAVVSPDGAVRGRVPVTASVSRPASGDGLAARVAQLEDEVADLRRALDDLRDALERATGG